MTDGYQEPEDEDFSDLDEWLCEYVDGTIDPAARDALEECMRLNPALGDHVQRLLEARNLLCRYGCRHHAPQGLQPRLLERLSREPVSIRWPSGASWPARLAALATITSLAALVLLLVSLDRPPEPQGTSRQIATVAPSPVRPLRAHLRATLLPTRGAHPSWTPSFAHQHIGPRSYPPVPPTLVTDTVGAILAP